ncbi:MAG TPA: hypothetical protein VLQ93_22070 [Myxococcaceae bacterium]|nr:hypothetical protein [Myxococcaceae bacterium]
MMASSAGCTLASAEGCGGGRWRWSASNSPTSFREKGRLPVASWKAITPRE